MGIKKSDIAGLTGAATSAVKAVKQKMKDDKNKQSQSPVAAVNKSAQANSAAGLGQNSSDQASYNTRYGKPSFGGSGEGDIG